MSFYKRGSMYAQALRMVWVLAALWLLPASVAALPVYAISSASSCDTCHIEPLGWANPDMSARRCTLDCVGCHVSPAGGGLRTPDGQYYGKEVLPTWGTRPSSFAKPEKYRPRGSPKRGKYSLKDGFSGWWAGKTDHTTIDERYGDIDPSPVWNYGGDFRIMALRSTIGEQEPQNYVFPMQADLYAMNESVKDLILYVSAGVQSRKSSEQFDNAELRDNFTIREIFMKYRLPYNSYVRFGRISPRYGWKVDDHSAFMRQDLGFNQYFSAFGMDAGYNPNYFYADMSLYYQGLARWPGERLERGIGTTINTGFRDLGWQAGASFGYLNRRFGFDQATAGVQWGLNLNPLVYYGSADLKRNFSDLEGVDDFTGFYTYNELNMNLSRGVYARFKYDWGDTSIRVKDDHKHRVQLALDWHPYTFVDLEFAYRINWTPRVDFTNIASTEAFLIGHVWF